MAKGESGRIVVEVSPELKCELYSALALQNKTLKEWFLECSRAYLAERAGEAKQSSKRKPSKGAGR